MKKNKTVVVHPLQALQVDELPSPPPGKVGWPWTESSSILPATMTDGSPWPRISIVTPSYNQGQFIEETIRSVLLQGYPNLEYIIIDGGSTDNSVEIIEKYSLWLDYWVSERDNGQSHAINKGLARCTGIWFTWVNSDDFLELDTLSLVAMLGKDHDVVAGSVRNFGAGFPDKLITNRNLKAENLILSKENSTYHQPAIWLKPKLIKECGGIDEKFQYAFDWDLMIRYLTLNPRVQYTDRLLCHFRLHNHSKTVSQQAMFHFEDLQILQKLSQNPRLEKWCDYKLRQFSWWQRIEELVVTKNYTRWQLALKILLEIFLDPQIRLSRFSLGAVRRILWR
ncbi:MAG: glycosyltransferase family 2 protein [Pseudanabaenaceae cyanobacterium]